MAARIHGASEKTDDAAKSLKSILAQQTQLSDVPLQFEARFALGESEIWRLYLRPFALDRPGERRERKRFCPNRAEGSRRVAELEPPYGWPYVVAPWQKSAKLPSKPAPGEWGVLSPHSCREPGSNYRILIPTLV